MPDQHEPELNDLLAAEPTPDPNSPELAHRQALAYGKDLARIYVAEKAKREELEVAYQMLDAVFTSSPDGLVVVDNAFNILHYNQAFANFTDGTQPTQQLAYQPLGNVLPSEVLVDALSRAAESEDKVIEVEFATPPPRRQAFVAKLWKLKTQKTQGWVIILHNQSKSKRLEYQKSEFVNIAAHELRTPLSGILGYADLLLSNEPADLTADQKRNYLEAILRGGQRLKRIVNELILFAEMNQTEFTISGVNDFSIHAVIEDVTASLRAFADEHLVTLQVLIAEDIPTIHADFGALRSALYQLVLNGINFNCSGGFVRIEAVIHHQNLELRVIDTGIGIAAEDYDLIFQPFFQVEGYMTRKVGGLGLGLSIARRAVTQLGGSLALESSGKQGSTFVIGLPMLESTAAAPQVSDLQHELIVAHQQSLAYAHDLKVLYGRLQHTNRALKEMNAHLEEADKLKSNFLGLISHELRSPFAGLNMLLQIYTRLGSDNLNDEQKTTFADILKSADSAYQTVDRLVKYAGLLSKQGTVHLDFVNLNQIADELGALTRPLAEPRGIRLHVDFAPNLVLARADAGLIREALWQLLQNALKATAKEGRITLRGRVETDCVTLQVEDSGVGIPTERQKVIWEPFVQGADSLARGMEGLGLGLPLVNYVATIHDGKTFLQSEVGRGSIVGFWIPIQRIPDLVEPAEST